MPQSLGTRVAVILVGGLVIAQLITGTIWSENRRRAILEIPVRVFVGRAVDRVRIVESVSLGQRQAVIDQLEHPAINLTLLDSEPEAGDGQDVFRVRAIAGRIAQERLGAAERLVVVNAVLFEDDEPASGSILFARSPSVELTIAIALPDGQWLMATGHEDEWNASLQVEQNFIDYLLRVYIVRIALVVLATLIAVRMVMKPLRQLADAAKALGEDIERPPLPLSGPQEVRQAAAAFNAMQKRLRETVAERARFLASVSHDLRSPITRLRLRTELLPTEVLKEKFRTDLTDMEAMIDGTLAYIQANESYEAREDVDLDALLLRMQAEYEEQGAQVSLSGKAGSPVRVMPQNLLRCLRNLIENAIRYGACAEIYLKRTERELVIEVCDRGPGIPEGELQSVLEPFRRLEPSRSATSGGFGLGLAIADNVAKAHGGNLILKNRSEGGLCAIVVLPLPGS